MAAATDHFTLTLSGSVQQLSSVLTAIGVSDITCRFLSLHADAGNTHVIYVGGYPRAVTSSSYGFRIEAPVSSVPPAPSIIELSANGSICLSELQVLGTQNEVLHLLVKV